MWNSSWFCQSAGAEHRKMYMLCKYILPVSKEFVNTWIICYYTWYPTSFVSCIVTLCVPWGIKLTTELHLALSLRMNRSCTSSPLVCFHGLYRDKLYICITLVCLLLGDAEFFFFCVRLNRPEPIHSRLQRKSLRSNSDVAVQWGVLW